MSLPANVLAAPAVAPVMWLGMAAAARRPGERRGGARRSRRSRATRSPSSAGSATRPRGCRSATVDVPPRCLVALVCLARGRGDPGPGGPASRARRAPSPCSRSSLVAAARTGAARRAPPAGLRVTFLDVGQGDATLIQDRRTRCSSTPARPTAASSRGCATRASRRLDLLVVTHAQADHDGGAAAVLRAMPVGLVLDGRDGVREPLGRGWRPRRGRRARARSPRPRPGRRCAPGGIELRVLSPAREAPRTTPARTPTSARSSPRLRAAPSGCCSPPTPSPTCSPTLDLGPVDVLKVSHHGSADPGLPALLERLAAAARGHRGRRAQHLRPPGAGHAAGAAGGGRRGVPHGPRRRRAASRSAATACWWRRMRDDRRGWTAVAAVPASAASRLGRVPTFKPAYLIHGDDHGRIAERRARLRALAERERGAAASRSSRATRRRPRRSAPRCSAMTFAIGRRFLIVDGVERWKDAEVEAHARAGARRACRPTRPSPSSPARRAGRRSPATLVDGGEEGRRRRRRRGRRSSRRSCRAGWSSRGDAARASKLDGAAAQALVAHVGERQQRLLRELEKLALEHGAGRDDRRRGGRGRRGAVGRAPGLGAGRRARRRATAPRRRAPSSSCARRASAAAARPAHGPPRPRGARRSPMRLEAGESPAQVKATLRMAARGRPTGASRRRGRPTSTRCARALEALADLELASRGGSELDEDTAALRAIDAIAAAWGEARAARERRDATGCAGADARGAGLLARAGVAVQRAALDGLVDRRDERAGARRRRSSSSPAATAASRRRKYVLIVDV